MRRVIVWAIGIVVSVGAVGAVAVRLPVVQDFAMRQVIARRMTLKSLTRKPTTSLP